MGVLKWNNTKQLTISNCLGGLRKCVGGHSLNTITCLLYEGNLAIIFSSLRMLGKPMYLRGNCSTEQFVQFLKHRLQSGLEPETPPQLSLISLLVSQVSLASIEKLKTPAMNKFLLTSSSIKIRAIVKIDFKAQSHLFKHI